MALVQAKPAIEPKTRSIQEALDVLDTALEESSAEIRNMLRADFKRLKNTIQNVSTEETATIKQIQSISSEAIRDLTERAKSASKAAAQRIDDSFRNNPWAYVGGIAAGALAVGYLLARQNNR